MAVVKKKVCRRESQRSIVLSGKLEKRWGWNRQFCRVSGLLEPFTGADTKKPLRTVQRCIQEINIITP